PSVEAFYRAKKKGYLLSGQDSSKQPKVEIISFNKERRIISAKVEERIKEKLKKGQSILIFLNRRGYASFLFCPSCGYIPRCPQCEISLTYHKKEKKLICHYCDFSLPKSDICPACGRRIIMMKSFGTEAVEEELKKSFPQRWIACFDTDVVKSKREEEKITNLFSKGKIDILIGTQLLAHQRNLKPASLVIILYPETQLSISDFRASQRTFQNIRQMIGLADESRGEVIIQTGLPDHFSLQTAASKNYLSFYKQEIEYRRLMNYPPFMVMAELWLQGKNLRTLARKSRGFTDRIKNFSDKIEILGPAVVRRASYRRKKGIQWILKTRKRKELETILEETFLKLAARKSILIYD
ncbi:MAG: primosomal protein N', partial [Candidatus Aminicenantales bacterium]